MNQQFNILSICTAKFSSSTGQYLYVEKDKCEVRMCNLNKCSQCIQEPERCQDCKHLQSLYLYNFQCIKEDECRTNFGYVNYTQKKCEKCTIGCETCKSHYYCLTCQQGYLLQSDTSICIPQDECPQEGYIVVIEKGICQKCPSQCQKCTIDKCELCIKNFYMFNGYCYSDCLKGQYPNKQNRVCEKCAIDLCEDCSQNQNICSLCRENTFYLEGQCSYYCRTTSGYFPDLENRICQKCTVKNCFSCSKSADQCQSCIGSLILFENQCTEQCPPKMFYSQQNKSCIDCNILCAACESQQYCTSCVDKALFIQDTKTCVSLCPSGYYSDTLKQLCIPCRKQCKECDDHYTRCSVCQNGYYKDNIDCIETCPEGYYVISTPLQKYCLKCSLNCKKCDKDRDNCIECKELGEALVQNKCISCYKGCSQCLGISNKECTKCYYNQLLEEGQCVPFCSENYIENETKEFCFPKADQIQNKEQESQSLYIFIILFSSLFFMVLLYYQRRKNNIRSLKIVEEQKQLIAQSQLQQQNIQALKEIQVHSSEQNLELQAKSNYLEYLDNNNKKFADFQIEQQQYQQIQYKQLPQIILQNNCQIQEQQQQNQQKQSSDTTINSETSTLTKQQQVIVVSGSSYLSCSNSGPNTDSVISGDTMQQNSIPASYAKSPKSQDSKENGTISIYQNSLNTSNQEKLSELKLTQFKRMYKKMCNLGQGTYGTVDKYKEIRTGNFYAVKRYKFYIQQGTLQEGLSEALLLNIVNQYSQNVIKLIKYFLIIDDEYDYEESNKGNLAKSSKIDNSHIESIEDIKQNQTEGKQDLTKFQNNSNKEQQLFLILELAECSLYDQIQQQRKLKQHFPEAMVFQVLKEMVNTLSIFHSTLSIAHRDIKPQNILYSQKQYKICDFGVSKAIENTLFQTNYHTLAGTLNYVSPEQKQNYVLMLTGQQNLQQQYNVYKSDIFSLGLSIYEMVTLKSIAGLNDSQDNIQKALDEINQSSFILCDKIKLAINRMLQWNPQNRITANQLSNTLI